MACYWLSGKVLWIFCIVAESWMESKTKTWKTALEQRGMLRIWRKDKNRSPFHGEKPLMIKWFLGKKRNQIFQSPKTILHGRDAILRVRDKWLIFNMVLQLWADVKYHVPTGFGFSPKASGFYPFGDGTDLVRGRRWWCGVADSSICLKSDMPQH